MEVPSSTPKSSTVKRESYFTRFRNRWKRRGVIEIDESHRKYPFTTYIQQGIRVSITSSGEIKENLIASDFTDKTKHHLVSSYDQMKFEFVTYAPHVFGDLRHRLGMIPDVYSGCVCPILDDHKYLEFVSNSKSGQNFFLSNDKQLMIKTHTANEKKFFLRILPRYIKHLKLFPHSLLVKFLGLYKLTMSKHEPVYFIVMQSILFPDERISHRYDLKACEAGRYTEEPEEDGNIITVLKDLNFSDRKIVLGSQSTWFHSQIKHDTEFLRGIGVIDYSLLIGIQGLHAEEIKENRGLASIFIRTKKSTSRRYHVLKNWGQSPKRLNTQISDESTASQTPPQEDDLHLPGTVHEDVEEIPKSEKTTPQKNEDQIPRNETASEGNSSPRPDVCSSVTETEAVAQNRRLLPHSRNELHVIDGSEQERYFVGIIDFFTPYGFKKRCESVVKTVRYRPSGLTFSTVHPNAYAERFQQFVQKHVV